MAKTLTIILLLIVAVNHRIYAQVDNANDGACLSQLDLLPHLYSGVDVISFITPGPYYIPMASKTLYRHYAEGLLGRPAASQAEVDSMQVVLNCGSLFTTINNVGFPSLPNPPSFAQACVFGGIPALGNLGLLNGRVNLADVQAVCLGLTAIRPNGTVALQPSPSFVATIDSIIWVNEDKTALLVYRCPADGLKDYKVLTKGKTLAQSDIDTVLLKVAALGFPQESAAYMVYQ